MVNQEFVGVNTSFPTVHPCHQGRGQVYAAVLTCPIPSDRLKTATPKQLTLPGHIFNVGKSIVVLEAIIPGILQIIRPRDAKSWILRELIKQIFQVVPLE